MNDASSAGVGTHECKVVCKVWWPWWATRMGGNGAFRAQCFLAQCGTCSWHHDNDFSFLMHWLGQIRGYDWVRIPTKMTKFLQSSLNKFLSTRLWVVEDQQIWLVFHKFVTDQIWGLSTFQSQMLESPHSVKFVDKFQYLRHSNRQNGRVLRHTSVNKSNVLAWTCSTKP
jgi:hypothetical protein